MLPRNPADYRSLLWALLMPTVMVVQYANPHLLPYLAPVSFLLAMSAGTMAHNHNHNPTFKNRRMNAAYAAWISLFYGYPTFAWVPTHNLNHHKHVNRAGDATITWRHTNRNTWWIALSYFFVSAYYQSGPIKEYIRKAKKNNPRLYRTIITQYGLWATAGILSGVIAVTMHGWKTGMLIWGFAVVGPGFFGTWSMMWFNYMQHVHTDPWSKHNHSRNITGRIFNFLVFNNGFHTVHHEHPGAHWSTLPALHAKIEAEIDPRLNQSSFWWWIIRGYVIPAFNKNWETQQIGRAPFDPPTGSGPNRDLATDAVDALDAGNNAQMA